ncbi:MAG: hydantoinase/oxoprolinase family protein [Xanthobacteraceae bacterium]|nr:hydantoinase/oxoprolinase family protein [Xanthobacteraceae bacterium]
MTDRHLLIGIDVGGTFTDAIVFDSSKGKFLAAFKIPSTPSDPGNAVVAAIEKIAQSIKIDGAIVFHGTTIGTNILIERKGARAALLATAGFSDVIELRRQARPNLYSFDVRISEPLVPSRLRFGVSERMSADGTVVEPLDAAKTIDALRDAGVDAVAVSFLHSYANASHEEDIAAQIAAVLPGVFVTRSSDVCPEFREYERTSTTVVNAYIGPAVRKYVTRLDGELRARGVDRLMIVKSSGGLTSPENAARYPVHLIESGPAAQLIASASFARATGRPNLVSFDMGGTTAKAGLIHGGRPEVTPEFYADRLADGLDVGGYAIRSSVLDLVEIGAGGGSIAWIDEARVLKVGPRSAGAVPGPACYGRGGLLPTVTDAHAVIGTLAPEIFLNAGIALKKDLAHEAIRQHIAEPFGWGIARAAYSIIDVAVANMAEMVRLATTRRGLDPRQFAILASGGAGPLHAAAVGQAIGASEIIVPPLPGMFSAFGATLGSVRHELTQTMLCPVKQLGRADLEDAFKKIKARAEALLAVEPRGAGAPRFERALDVRFVGQLFELKVPVGQDDEPLPEPAQIETSFRALYRAEYGIDLPDAQVQIVNLRMVAEIDLGHRGDAAFAVERREQKRLLPYRIAKILGRDGSDQAVSVYRASEAAAGVLDGPAIIEHAGSTVWVHAGQHVVVEATGEVRVSLPHGGS